MFYGLAIIYETQWHIYYIALRMGAVQMTWTNRLKVRYLEKGLASVVRRSDGYNEALVGSVLVSSLHQEVADVFLYLIRLSHKVGL